MRSTNTEPGLVPSRVERRRHAPVQPASGPRPYRGRCGRWSALPDASKKTARRLGAGRGDGRRGRHNGVPYRALLRATSMPCHRRGKALNTEVLQGAAALGRRHWCQGCIGCQDCSSPSRRLPPPSLISAQANHPTGQGIKNPGAPAQLLTRCVDNFPTFTHGGHRDDDAGHGQPGGRAATAPFACSVVRWAASCEPHVAGADAGSAAAVRALPADPPHRRGRHGRGLPGAGRWRGAARRAW